MCVMMAVVGTLGLSLLLVASVCCNGCYRYIGSVDVRRAMRALGFHVSREQARQMVEETGLKGEGYDL